MGEPRSGEEPLKPERPASSERRTSAAVGRYTLALAAAWSCLVLGLAGFEMSRSRRMVETLARSAALTHFDKDQALRRWVASHGGVYVPMDPRTPPNPYLAHVPERDLVTPSGRRLTLMNPAYLLHQVQEEFGKLYGVAGKIVSLRPLNPANQPDAWERAGLQAFEQGLREADAVAEVGGEPHFRLMRPMVTAEGCLSCHGDQGYRAGDVRGGVSVAVPLAPYLQKHRTHVLYTTLSAGLVWALGLTGLWLGASRLRRLGRAQEQTAAALQESEARYRAVFDHAGIAIGQGDLEGRLVRVNPAFARLLGYSAEELAGASWEELTHPEDLPESRRLHEELLAGRRDRYELEKRYGSKERGWVWVRLTVTCQRGADGRPSFLIGAAEDIGARKQAEERLGAHQARLRELTAELSRAEERERRRVAAVLHDQVGHSLALAKMKLALLLRTASTDEERALLREVRGGIDQAVIETRTLTTELGSPVLYELGLVPALEQLSEQAGERYGLRTEVRAEALPWPLDQDDQVLVYQAARELLFNVAKHARARRVTVSLATGGGEVRLAVEDDGAGFDPAEVLGDGARGGGFGLFSVRERLAQRGGRLEISSRPGYGARVAAVLPLRRAPAEGGAP